MVGGVALSEAGKLATTGYDKTVRIWEFPPPGSASTQAAHRDAITRVAAWSLGGRSFAISASKDHDLAVFSLDSLTQQFRLSQHTHWVGGIAVAAQQNLAVSVSWDGTIALWHLDSGKLLDKSKVPMPICRPSPWTRRESESSPHPTKEWSAFGTLTPAWKSPLVTPMSATSNA